MPDIVMNGKQMGDSDVIAEEEEEEEEEGYNGANWLTGRDGGWVGGERRPVTVWRIGEGGEAWWQRDGEARRAVWRLHGGILFWRRTHSFPGGPSVSHGAHVLYVPAGHLGLRTGLCASPLLGGSMGRWRARRADDCLGRGAEARR